MSVLHDLLKLVQGTGHPGAVSFFKAFEQGNPRCAARLEEARKWRVPSNSQPVSCNCADLGKSAFPVS
jgi:hypothetical protein